MVICRVGLDFKVNGFSAVHANVRGKALNVGIADAGYVPVTWGVARLRVLASNGVSGRRTRICLAGVASHRLIGNRFWPSGALARSLKPKACVSMGAE